MTGSTVDRRSLAAAFTLFLTTYALTRQCRMAWPIASMVLLAALCAVMRVDLVPPSGDAPGQLTVVALLPLHHWLWAIPPAVFVVTLFSQRRTTVRSA